VTERIFIYCDDEAQHPGRRAAITNFLHTRGGEWMEKPATRAKVEGASVGHHLIGDELGRPGWALAPGVSIGKVRTHFELVCRRCRPPRPLRVTPGTLYPVLTKWQAAGEFEIPLAALAASVARSGKATGLTNPEPEQG